MFPLLNGTFTITTRTGDTLSGICTGEIDARTSGPSTAMLELQVTGGTGAFAGATGAFEGDGSGQFTGAGSFVLSSLKGAITTAADPAGAKFHVSVNGTSSISCSAANRIVLILRGMGNIATVDRFNVELRAEVGNTECSS